jgi:hypothetical protein
MQRWSAGCSSLGEEAHSGPIDCCIYRVQLGMGAEPVLQLLCLVRSHLLPSWFAVKLKGVMPGFQSGFRCIMYLMSCSNGLH